MQITNFLAAILLAAPALVTAVPVANDNGISAVNDVFARQENCNPQFSNDPAVRAKQQEAAQRMRALTPRYHAAENRCPKTAKADFGKKNTNKQIKERLKKNCYEGYSDCVPLREEANKACIAAGGQSDQGHKNAVKFCKKEAAYWKAAKVA